MDAKVKASLLCQAENDRPWITTLEFVHLFRAISSAKPLVSFASAAIFKAVIIAFARGGTDGDLVGRFDDESPILHLGLLAGAIGHLVIPAENQLLCGAFRHRRWDRLAVEIPDHSINDPGYFGIGADLENIAPSHPAATASGRNDVALDTSC